MNRINKYIVKGLAIALGSLALVACSDWVNPESVELNYPTLEDKNPELYEAYMESLREYRNSDHKVVIAKFNNSAEAPNSRAQHLNCLPDSVDYVILNNPDNLSDVVISEKEEITKEKGIKVMAEINYRKIELDYKEYVEAWEEENAVAEVSGDEGSEEGGSEELSVKKTFDEFMTESVASFLTVVQKYDYAGFSVIWNGASSDSMHEEEIEAYLAAQNSFFSKIMEWKNANETALLFFEGAPHNLITEYKVLDAAKYIIISSLSTISAEGFTYNIKTSMGAGVPNDKFVIGVTTMDINDKTNKDGQFSGIGPDGKEKTAIYGAGEWAIISDNFTKAGICITNAEYDYYNRAKIYKNIREAIGVMNPSPIN